MGHVLHSGYACREGSFQGGEVTRVETGVGEDLAEVGWSAEVDSGGCFKEIVCGGVSGEDVETFSEDAFEFRKTRIISDKGAVV